MTPYIPYARYTLGETPPMGIDTNGTPLNTSGIIPFDKRVLVLHDPVETKIGSIILTDDAVDKKKYAQTTATVIAVGDLCWGEARVDSRNWGIPASFPQAGDRVLVGRYTGDVHKGDDGVDYVILNDGDIIAFLDKEVK